jgi:2-C-methyl-D-erythritol 2,4-cyclodiphosphate synthase
MANRKQQIKLPIRIGQGFDIHKLVKNRKLILGGVGIPNSKGSLGHSDGDCLVHAIIDSLLGAANLDDIGKHFPDNDKKYKNINSLFLLEKIKTLLIKNHWEIINIDSTIIIEEPKLGPFREKMQKNIARTLDLDLNNISIKFKTNEGQDSVGKGESVISYATSLLCYLSYGTNFA